MHGRFGIFLLGIVSLAGCAAKEHLSAREYREQADARYRESSYGVAVEQYKELLDQHPFSEFNEEAEVRIAHSQYLNGSYPEAVVALTDFQRRHPTSPYLAFVGYLLGMCYVQQIDTVDRDHTAAQNALSYFNTVTQQFPGSPFADLARQELSRCREHLAEHELYVADYYSGQGNKRAAEIRLLDLATRYADTQKSPAALWRLANLYESREQTKEEALALNAVVQGYPRSDEAARAKRRLDEIEGGAAAPGSGDPIDALLALNGRDRDSGNYEAVPVPVPGLETSKGPRVPSGVPGVGGFGNAFDPFGRGRTGRAY